MNTTSKTLSALAVAGMIAGLSVSKAVAAEPGILAKGNATFTAHENSCNGKDSCEGKDDCKAKDECKAADSCKAKTGDDDSGSADGCSGKDGCSGN